MAENSLTIKGIIRKINDEQIITSTFKKRVFEVEETGEYPNYYQIEFTQDKCSELDKASVGQEVQVECNVNARKWVNNDGKKMVFTTLQAWRIGSVGMVDNFDDLPM